MPPGLPNFLWVDNEKETFFFPKVSQTHVLSLSSKPAKGHAGNLSRELDCLFRLIGLENLIFLGEYRRAWRYQENSYPPVQDALAYLKENRITKKFDGGLDVSSDEWPNFFRHLFWLVRCNAALPAFHFMDSHQTMIGAICQYGNLHLSPLTSEAEKKFLQARDKTSFAELNEKRCFPAFPNHLKL